MKLADPGRWLSATEAIRLARGNEAALAGCRSQAAKAMREQHCTITVPAQ